MLCIALRRLRPGAQWHLLDCSDPSTLQWLDTGQSAPSLAEIDAEVASLQASGVGKTQFSYLEFEALFTSAEQAAILAAAQGNVALFQWLLRSAGAQTIDLTAAETKAGLDALVTAGLITAARETQILAGTPPG